MSFVEKMQDAIQVIQDYDLKSVIDVRVSSSFTEIHLFDANEMNKFSDYKVIVRRDSEFPYELKAMVNVITVFSLSNEIGSRGSHERKRQ